MKKALLIGSVITLISCSAMAATQNVTTSNNPNQAMDMQNMPHMANMQNPQAQFQDGQIVEIIKVIDKGEISSSKEASKKATGPVVKKFADFMIAAHSKNLRDTENVSKQAKIHAKASDQSKALKQQGKQELKSLKSAPAGQFDVVYINFMVQDHQAALNLIDTQLLPSASNPALKKQLQMTRMAVAHHLEAAQKIQAGLNKLSQTTTSR